MLKEEGFALIPAVLSVTDSTKIAATYSLNVKKLKNAGGLCMEHIRELLQTCRSGKEVIEKVWTLQEKEQQKV